MKRALGLLLGVGEDLKISLRKPSGLLGEDFQVGLLKDLQIIFTKNTSKYFFL